MFKLSSYCMAITLLVSYTVHTYAMDRLQIDQKAYNAIKMAVFTKKGEDYAASFNQQYPQASQESVIALSKEFDAGSCQGWQECYPPKSDAYINGQEFGIRGKIAVIIYNRQNGL
jgi:hypothetical protein